MACKRSSVRLRYAPQPRPSAGFFRQEKSLVMNNTLIIIILSYFVVINIVAFILYGIDKKHAVRRKTRIPVSVLLWMARLGGGLGSWFSMSYYHHKKNHTRFKRLVPLWIFIWLFGLVLLFAFTTGDIVGEIKEMREARKVERLQY